MGDLVPRHTPYRTSESLLIGLKEHEPSQGFITIYRSKSKKRDHGMVLLFPIR